MEPIDFSEQVTGDVLESWVKMASLASSAVDIAQAATKSAIRPGASAASKVTNVAKKVKIPPPPPGRAKIPTAGGAAKGTTQKQQEFIKTRDAVRKAVASRGTQVRESWNTPQAREAFLKKDKADRAARAARATNKRVPTSIMEGGPKASGGTKIDGTVSGTKVDVKIPPSGRKQRTKVDMPASGGPAPGATKTTPGSKGGAASPGRFEKFKKFMKRKDVQVGAGIAGAGTAGYAAG